LERLESIYEDVNVEHYTVQLLEAMMAVFSYTANKTISSKTLKRFHHQLWKFDNCFNSSENLIISWHKQRRWFGSKPFWTSKRSMWQL